MLKPSPSPYANGATGPGARGTGQPNRFNAGDGDQDGGPPSALHPGNMGLIRSVEPKRRPYARPQGICGPFKSSLSASKARKLALTVEVAGYKQMAFRQPSRRADHVDACMAEKVSDAGMRPRWRPSPSDGNGGGDAARAASDESGFTYQFRWCSHSVFEPCRSRSWTGLGILELHSHDIARAFAVAPADFDQCLVQRVGHRLGGNF